MDTQLANCPFCGGKGIATDEYSVDDITWVVVCENVDGWGAHCDTREEAIAAWNKRVASTALEQAAPAFEPVPDGPGWNPVGESLPENHAWVLVYADGAINCMGYTPGKGFEDWTLQQAPNIVIQEITHWRHLPAGPIAQRPATAAGEEV